MAKTNSKPTMKDVAKKAGVALGTVSKVFNDLPVGEGYKEKVLQAAEELGYQVNHYARGLKTNKTYTVALILPGIVNPFFSAIAENISRVLYQKGYRMLLSITNYDTNVEAGCFSMAEQNKVDGIICLSYNPTLKASEDFRIVTIDRYLGASIPCISSDNYGGGYLAARQLHQSGSSHLLFLHSASKIYGEADKRQLGFESYCRQNQVSHDCFVLSDGEDWQQFWDYLDEHISDGTCSYDGIFCGTDFLAYHTLKHLHARGIRIPQDLQVIGFDGCRKFGGPADDLYCSTIIQPTRQIAEMAVETLLREDSSSYSSLICLPVTFEHGGTTRE